MKYSPGRERSDRYSKIRDYFQQPNGVQWWKRTLCVVALLTTVFWIAWGFVKARESNKPILDDFRFSHGPLASPHTTLNSECGACHKKFDSVAEFTSLSAIDIHKRWHSFDCSSCHAGPAEQKTYYAPHLESFVGKNNSGEQCSDCHRDHSGADASLVKIPDGNCLNCHRDLGSMAEFVKHSTPNIAKLAEHPNFRILKERNSHTANNYDRGLKFSHAQHLTPGMPISATQTGLFTLEKLKPSDRERYATADQLKLLQSADSKVLQQAVQLQCVSCHTSEPAPGQLKTDGAYMQPVKFEERCQACHALNTGPIQSRDFPTLKLPAIQLPHRLQRNDLASYLRAKIADVILHDSTSNPKPPINDRLDPRQKEVVQTFEEQVRKIQTTLERMIFDSGEHCAKCHTFQPANSEPRAIAPVNIPAVWLPQGRFNHASHKTMNCVLCHENKQPLFVDGKVDVTERGPVGIADFDSCRVCHSPKHFDEQRKQEVGGVRHDCVYCHRYHNGERGLSATETDRWNRLIPETSKSSAILQGRSETPKP
ncbi:hypothetical protein KIH39_22415 [Telmatocola sphagniphila]|uniref:Doubled CXXCH motif domain-containing protein n=1 Tax=Telmatocola sphagniphila TaxID=1123043 RepID=A0A8E6EUL4_9BACT|nr:cytochrome c3 family protein [Telmatocola sphagniphila]QVL31570.1 hypothetical protein KIH39_22415 [Telmatocola sphagniphila]